MKVIKFIILAIVLLTVACNDIDNLPSYEDGNLSEHVHFALILNSNGDPVYDEVDPTEDYASVYNHMFYDTIYIPVSMTRKSTEETIEVHYTAEMFGDDQTAHFYPDSVLTFGPNQYSDTIEVTFDSRWFIDTKDSIILTLTEVSNPDMEIGYPYGNNTNNVLTITLDEILFAISTSKPSSFEIEANTTPTYDFQLNFENGFIYDELKDLILLKEKESNLDYTLTQHPFEEGDMSIAYTFTMNAPVEDKYSDYKCVLEVIDIEGYKTSGGSEFEFIFNALDQSSYTFLDDQILILGDQNEKVNIDIIFSSAITEANIANLDTSVLLVEIEADFQYTLERQAVIVGDEKVSYILTVLDNIIDQPSELFAASFELQAIDGFTPFGNTELDIQKNPINLGDVSVNPASHFYNNASPGSYSLTYCYFWTDHSNDGSCRWWESFAHTYPLEVEASDPNAILHTNGKYYHAFRFGFNSPNAGTTTNSLALKHWFDNESTDATVSPGFNVTEAIDLFPKDGTSRTEGTAVIVEQDLIIGSKDDESYVIHIAGNGEYYYDEGSYEIYTDSIYSIAIDLEVTSEELFGGTRIRRYIFKNRNMDEADQPEAPSFDCFPATQL